MQLTFSQDRIIALMGNQEPKGSDECRIAMHIVDALLENKDSYGDDFHQWTSELAVEIWADEHFLEREEIEASEIDWNEVDAAVKEALRILNMPVGTTLVESNSWLVYACGDDLEGAQKDLIAALGISLSFEAASRDQVDRYIIVKGPVPEGGWTADDAPRVLAMGGIDGYLMARQLTEDVV